MFGRPDEIISDNGPQYSGEFFKRFTNDWNIKHVTSSTNYPRSNGFIERHVKHIKSALKKTIRSGDYWQMTLLNLRATPIDNKLPSPAELLLGKPISTLLPNHGDLGQEEKCKYLQQKRERTKEEYDKRCQQELPPLYKGQAFRILDKNSKTWCPGTINKKCEEPRSYIVQTPNGTNLRSGDRDQTENLGLHSAHGSVSIHEAGVTSELGPPNNAGKESRPGERELDLLDKLYNWHGSHSSLSIHGRPYSMDDGRTRVYIAPVLTQLIEFDVKKQMLEGHFAVAMRWVDPRLTWKRADYDDIHAVFIPPANIWTPDIVTYNSTREEGAITDGTVFWMPSIKYRLRCTMTVKYFPWDTHNCASAFGSWTLSNNELSLEVLELLAPPRLFKDNVWDIVNNGYGLDVLEFADKFNEVLNYTLLTYSLTFHRRDGFLAYLMPF
ncbi:hypothetical protein LSH36_11g04010 [Paralvinella palmiformis]|uniref:Integrase catalytic domain-containing protein n=1 Tax=Paralvinella palmiformis TaxID=53620 RepID=A0AAD9NI93_9ANNE|nr:hypothetical protein LSH36_11g04010 [Paralvinella palmiformis]